MIPLEKYDKIVRLGAGSPAFWGRHHARFPAWVPGQDLGDMVQERRLRNISTTSVLPFLLLDAVDEHIVGRCLSIHPLRLTTGPPTPEEDGGTTRTTRE